MSRGGDPTHPPENRWLGETVKRVPATGLFDALDERKAELAMFQVLLTSMKKRQVWDQIKCVIATGIPAFWLLIIVLGPHLPTATTSSLPVWFDTSVESFLKNVPAVWTILLSLAVAAFQWYNIIHYQRHVIPLVREMYEWARSRRDPVLLDMLEDALRFTSLKAVFRTIVPGRSSRPW